MGRVTQLSVDVELFKSMLKEEWRLHQSFIGRLGSVMFPVFTLVFTIFIAFFGQYALQNLNRDTAIQILHGAALLYGLFVGALGGMGEQVMTRRLGQVSMLLQLPQQYPVSFKRVMGIFFVKDALFYFGYTFLPLTVGLLISSPIIDVEFVEMFMGGATLFMTFMLGMASSFFLSAVYTSNKKTGGILLLAVALLIGLVWPLELIPLGELLPPLGYWSTGNSISLTLSVVYIVSVSVLGALSVKEKYESKVHVYENRLLKDEAKFTWIGDLSTLLSKEWLELKRSGGLVPVVGGFLGLIMGIYGLISIFEMGMGIYLPFNVISYSGFVGFMGVMTYSMITGIEPNDYMNMLPISVEKVVKAKVTLYLMLTAIISTGYVVVIGLMRDEALLIPLGLLTSYSTAIYIAAVTAYLTGLWTNTLFFDIKILAKFAALVVPGLTALEVAAFWVSNSYALAVILGVSIMMMLVSKPLLDRVGEKWDGKAFSYVSNNTDW